MIEMGAVSFHAASPRSTGVRLPLFARCGRLCLPDAYLPRPIGLIVDSAAPPPALHTTQATDIETDLETIANKANAFWLLFQHETVPSLPVASSHAVGVPGLR